ncbi:YhgE/Pip domain-containing protein [Pseudoclavibacter helvolus]|uniref:YhgE/Pip domain-containing protein n=1 Tax=Pseudoclavibacter helvolus TaxID=255205 RepID=UPI003C71E498
MSAAVLHAVTADRTALRRRRLRNLLVAILVPLFAAGAYFAGLAGAEARTAAIPAMIVNNDELQTMTGPDGTETTVIAGRLVVSALTDPETPTGFDWQLADADTARAALEDGSAYVVVTIPDDFSARIAGIADDGATPATIDVTTDQSHDYLSPAIANGLADALTAQFGTQVTEMVAVQLFDGIGQTASSLRDAADGAALLADGGTQLGTGLAQFSDGQRELGTGLTQSADGATELSSGVTTYVSGVSQLSSGVTQYTGGVDQLSAGITQYTSGADQLAAGVGQLALQTPTLRDGGQQLQGAGAQLEAYSTAVTQGTATYQNDIRPVLVALNDSTEGLVAWCAALADPTLKSECEAQLTALAGTTGGVDGLVDTLDNATGELTAVTEGASGLTELGAGLVTLADGIDQLNTGATQLSAGSSGLTSGASDLVTAGDELERGASQLATGGTELQTGASALATGLGQLRDGQQQLADGVAPIQDGVGELTSGATQLSTGLNDGAAQAENAVGDPEALAGVVANPIEANTTMQHEVSFGEILTALILPLTLWLAALATTLMRRLVPTEAYASMASNGRILLDATKRMLLPLAVVLFAVLVIAHGFLAVPVMAAFATLGLGALCAIALIGIHLLFTTLWGRRAAAVASIGLLSIQVLAIRGLVPLELKSPFVETLSGLLPGTHLAAGLQLAYSGGSASGVVTAAIGMIVIGAVGFAAASLVIGRRRRSKPALVAGLAAGRPELVAA